MAEGIGTFSKQTEEEAFPEVKPRLTPLGARVLVQLKTTKKTSSGGIVLVEETKDTEKWNTQIAKVIKLGPLAFCNRETGLPWAEGMWVSTGDYVRVPRWGGDRVEVKVEGTDDKALFCVFNDHELMAKIDDAETALKMVNFIL
jgi:co-chaperonin GroES (HSP10)